ncbi:sensor histidine kinase [Actinomadura rayongensis]|uniref:histidine kinase n=1 Tax=Actinomadura rayongensis TaxID=1429076 RepID=A0A6I4WC28_9ACTN|nr:HAMP domain-containing sensor histidine kinase [Actinomadura rayongensis]MXQ65556.1 HAMP domain-containing protein [Actinomadura rayongensis]
MSPRRLLPRPTVRLRLTLLYGGVFLAASAALLTVTYVLVDARYPAPIALGTGGAISVKVDRLGGAGKLQVADQQDVFMHRLMVESGIALAMMMVVAVALGWLIAGRILRPLRVVTATARQISEDDLHRRLDAGGPNDELKDLADTIDGLLGRMEEAFEAQRRFVAHASHELHTPLAAEKAMLEVALADPDATVESLRTTCEEVLEVGRQQERLIEALLTLARSQRGLDHREPFNLAAVVTNVLQTRQPLAEAKGLRLDADVVSAPAAGDRRLAERLVINLVDNGLRHNVAGGEVLVTTRVRDGEAVLTVSNTGPVVPPEQIDRLLQPFQRLAAGRTGTDSDGLGLGLSIVAAIVKAHGAALRVRPRPGGGLDIEVAFALPATARPGDHANGRVLRRIRRGARV